jgi:thiamine pyrophosphokinase
VGPELLNLRDQKAVFKKVNLQPQDFLIGVDGGVAIALRHRLKMDLAVGDWDSLKFTSRQLKKLLSELPHITLSPEKDRSDLFHSALAALEMGATRLTCVGVTGGRPDHQVAMLLELGALASGKWGRLTEVKAIGPDADYYFLSTKIPDCLIQAPVGSLISIFSLSEKTEGLSLRGLKYKFRNNKRNHLFTPSSVGLSNVTVQRKVHVSLRKGLVVVIMPHHGHERSKHHPRL